MKVLNLQCSLRHSFEGWFASEADYADQQERRLLTCPLCGDASIHKLLSAPRLNLKGGREPMTSPSAQVSDAGNDRTGGREIVDSPVDTERQGRLVEAMRDLLAKTEDVGERFADEARGMHHGDIAPRNIRGQTTPDVAQELIEEGIDVVALPVLPGLKATLQ